jgi:hypothetical protein
VRPAKKMVMNKIVEDKISYQYSVIRFFLERSVLELYAKMCILIELTDFWTPLYLYFSNIMLDVNDLQ